MQNRHPIYQALLLKGMEQVPLPGPSSWTGLTAMYINRIPPIACKKGIFKRNTITTVKIILNKIAPELPSRSAIFVVWAVNCGWPWLLPQQFPA
jgi:hypothetical protein